MPRKARNLTELNEGAIKCRTFGHAWKPWTARPDMDQPSRTRGWNVTLACNNDCGTFKHFQLSQRGEYGPPHYTYADGYLASFPIGADEKALLRMEVLGLSWRTGLRVIKGAMK